MDARDHQLTGHVTGHVTGTVTGHVTGHLRRLAAVTAVTALAGALLVGSASTATARTAASYERGVLAQVNAARTAQDLRPVRMARCPDRLAKLATVRAARGRTSGVRASELRRSCGLALAGQTVRTVRLAPRGAVRGLLRRPASRRALLARDATTIGVAALRAGGRWHVGLVLAKHAGSGTGSGGTGSGTENGTGSDEGGGSGSTTGDESGGTTGDTTGDTTGGTDPGVTDSLTEAANAILAETNSRRARHGLDALRASGCATSFAEDHSAHQLETDELAHADLADLKARCKARGVAENVAALTSAELDAVALVDLWMASTLHRRNILDPGLTHLGVGVAHDPATDSWYVTQDFLTKG